MEHSAPPVLTVTQLTSSIKQLLEARFPLVTVEGELSNFRPSSSGHIYFTLKDAEATIQAVLFKGKAARLAFSPADGQKVVLTGSLSVYAQRGNYQIIVERMEKSGEGALLAMLEERKRRLAAEGLFDADRKRPLPLVPRRVAVITSPTGAALRDILRVLGRRNSGIDIVILPAIVQGEQASAQICRQLATANAYAMADVIILGRGGGSIEDLLPFSTEEVVRAVAASAIPVVSAVGHEIDWALCDFAADVRAPTPSAAAEVVAAARSELGTRVGQTMQELRSAITRRLQQARQTIKQFSPDEIEHRFRALLQPSLMRLDDAKSGLLTQFGRMLQARRLRLSAALAATEAASPREVLNKGYSIVRDTDGKVIRDASLLSPGNQVSIEFHQGAADASITKTR